MKSFITLFLFILIFQGQALAQSSITGEVKDKGNKAIPFVNVLLLKPNDSTLIKGVVAKENGSYAIENIAQGNYLICAAMIGFRKAYTSIVSNEPDQRIQIPTIVLQQETTQLKEVQVTARKPLLEQRIDRTIVNISNSIISTGSTALEILERAPGVTIDKENDQIRLRGKEGVLVQLDGKQTYLAMSDIVALLRGMPSDNIELVEIITNPSAKYDAAGNSGIINIKTKKSNTIGTNGSISLSAGSGRYDRQRGGVQLNHRGKKFNVFGSTNFNRNGNFFRLIVRQDREAEEDLLIRTRTFLPMRDIGTNANAGVDYFIGKRTTIGIIWTGTWNKLSEKGSAKTEMTNVDDNSLFLLAHTYKTILNRNSNQLGNINLNHKFLKNNAEISADLDIGLFSRTFENDLLTAISQDENERVEVLENQMPTTIDIITAKVDYTQSVFKTWKLEAGLKSSYVNTDNNMKLSRGDPSEVFVDPSASNHFKYTERVGAAYLTVSGDIGASTKILAGVRTEYTESKGNSINLQNVVKRQYLNVFPSAFISRKISEKHSLNFSYSYRIDRPNYQSLNPARSYVDPYNFGQGNAYLRPQYAHSLELKHGFKEKYFTSIGTNLIDDYVLYVVQPLDSIRTNRTPLNFGKNQSYNITISFPLTIAKGWTAQMTVNGFYIEFQYTFLGVSETSTQFSSNLNLFNSFAFGKGWSAELTGLVFTPSVDVQRRVDWFGALNFGVQKKINEQIKVNFNAQDLFWTQRYRVHTTAPGFDNKGNVSFDTRAFMVTASYSLGNQNLKGARQRKTASEEENKRTIER